MAFSERSMGCFYTNYTLRGPSQQAVADAQAGREVLAAPEKNGCVVVFDKKSEGQEFEVIVELGSNLSIYFSCPLLAEEKK